LDLDTLKIIGIVSTENVAPHEIQVAIEATNDHLVPGRIEPGWF